jgi:hypothetical protein
MAKPGWVGSGSRAVGASARTNGGHGHDAFGSIHDKQHPPVSDAKAVLVRCPPQLDDVSGSRRRGEADQGIKHPASNGFGGSIEFASRRSADDDAPGRLHSALACFAAASVASEEAGPNGGQILDLAARGLFPPAPHGFPIFFGIRFVIDLGRHQRRQEGVLLNGRTVVVRRAMRSHALA